MTWTFVAFVYVWIGTQKFTPPLICFLHLFRKGSMQGMLPTKKTCISLILIIFIFVSSKNFIFKTFTGFNLVPWMILHFWKIIIHLFNVTVWWNWHYDFEQEIGSFENIHGNLDFGRWSNSFIHNLPIYVRGESIVTYMLIESFA